MPGAVGPPPRRGLPSNDRTIKAVKKNKEEPMARKPKTQQPKRGRGRPPGNIARQAIGSHMRLTTANRIKEAANDENMSMSQWVEPACVRELERSKENAES